MVETPTLAVEEVEFQLNNGMLEQYDEAAGQYVPVVEADGEQVDSVTGYRVFFQDRIPVAMAIGEQNIALANDLGLFELGENAYYWQNEAGLQRFIPLDNSTHWVNGRRPMDEMAGYQLDQQTGLIAAVNAEGIPVAYFAPQVEGGKWIVNPLLETAYEYDYERLETGQWVVNHFGVEYGYKPYELAGVELVKPSELPASFSG